MSYTTRVLLDHYNLCYFMIMKEFIFWQARQAEKLTQFDFKIEYKPRESNLVDRLLRWLDYAKGFKTGDRKQIVDILLPMLQNKLQVWAAQARTALCTEFQAVQALLALYSDLASTWTMANEGLKIPRQDIPDISLELGDILLLIAKLSP